MKTCVTYRHPQRNLVYYYGMETNKKYLTLGLRLLFHYIKRFNYRITAFKIQDDAVLTSFCSVFKHATSDYRAPTVLARRPAGHCT